MPEDKYKIIVEVVKDEFNRFNEERKYALQKDVDDHKTANRLKVEDTKASNAVVKAELRALQSQLTKATQAELEAYKHGNQLKIKEAIASRKILEGEIKGYNAVLRGELRKEYEEFKTNEERKRAEFRKSITEMSRAPVTRLRGEIGSETYVRQLQSAQTTMLPGSEEFTATGLLIAKYKEALKEAGVEVKSLSEKIGGELNKALIENADKANLVNLENIKMAAGWLGITFGMQQVISFAKESIAVWGEQEASIKAVDFAVTKVTGQNKSLTASLISYSGEVQSVFKLNDEVIQQQEAYLVLQGRSEEQIRETIQAAIDLSAAQGKLTDENVIDNILKLDATREGSLGKLTKYDSRLKDLTKDQLMNGEAVRLLGQKYSGMGQEIQSGTQGATKSIGILWNETKEFTGELLSHTGPVMKQIIVGFETYSRNAKEGQSSTVSFTEAIKAASLEIPLMGAEISGVIGWIQELIGVQKEFNKAQLQISLPNVSSVVNQWKNFSSENLTNDLQQISYWTGIDIEQLKLMAKEQNLFSDAKEREAKEGSIDRNKEKTEQKDIFAEKLGALQDQHKYLVINYLLNTESLQTLLKQSEELDAYAKKLSQINQLTEFRQELEQEIFNIQNRIPSLVKKTIDELNKLPVNPRIDLTEETLTRISPEFQKAWQELFDLKPDFIQQQIDKFSLIFKNMPIPADIIESIVQRGIILEEAELAKQEFQEMAGYVQMMADLMGNISGLADESAQKWLSVVQYMFTVVAQMLQQLGDKGEISPMSILGSIIGLIPFLFDEGGYTGEGSKYDMAGIVHKREFVFDADTTAKYRPLFEYIHGNKSHSGIYYDTGGYVSPIAQQNETNKRNSMYMGRFSGNRGAPINLNLQLKGDLDLVKFMDLVADVMPGVNVILDNKNY